VLKTKWPVRAASMAMEAVSGSPIFADHDDFGVLAQ
jgi:hypothetical protein